MSSIAELVVAFDVERQLGALCADSPGLGELPIAPLRSVDDLVRLELALTRFSEVHRSRRSKAFVRAVRATLDAARDRLRAPVAAHGFDAAHAVASATQSPAPRSLEAESVD